MSKYPASSVFEYFICSPAENIKPLICMISSLEDTVQTLTSESQQNVLSISFPGLLLQITPQTGLLKISKQKWFSLSSEGQKFKIRISAGPHSVWSLCGYIIPISTPVFTWPSVSMSSPLLIKKTLIGFKAYYNPV